MRVRHLLIFLGLGICALVVMLVYVLWELPNPSELTTHPAPASTKLLDRHGTLIYEIYADVRRTPVKLGDLPLYVKLATLAAEDRDFYSHSGFSIRGIVRAILNTTLRGRLQGGSTITQQLVKKALLNDDRTPTRKMRELVLSLLTEARYTKDQILEFYLNQVPYGGTAYGIESASQTYFGKAASELDLAEAALLAALPVAPSIYSPFGSRPELGLERMNYVLNQMRESKMISQEEFEQATAENLKFATPATLLAPHFSLWVKDKLLEKYGTAKVYEQGLVVTTSLDLALQEAAQKAVSLEVGKLVQEHVTNGAALVTSPKTGEILAMVGSKDYFDTAGGGNVNVTIRLRQPGSAIKPINYAIGIDRGLITASTILADKPTCFNQAGQKPYCPTNYDQKFHGPTQVRYALGNSFNIPAVKALTIVGLGDFVNFARKFGITTFSKAEDYGPSITLGGGEVTMVDLSTAYSVLANAGQRVDLNPFLHIEDRNGQVLEKVSAKAVAGPTNFSFTVHGKLFTPNAAANIRVISPGSAFIVSQILTDNGARAAVFGSRSYLDVLKRPDVAVKTGTTNDKRDNWTIGYNGEILVNVWVGNNDNSPMSRVASGITGASPIWNKIITQALTSRPLHQAVPPPDVVGKYVCATSGLIAPDPAPGDCPTRYEYFMRVAVPPTHTTLRRDIQIYRPSQSTATARQIVEEGQNIETQNRTAVVDPVGAVLCLDCPGQSSEADEIYLDRNGRAQRLEHTNITP